MEVLNFGWSNAVEEFLDIDEIDLIVHFSDGEGYFSQDHDALLDTQSVASLAGQSGNNYGGKEIEEKGFGRSYLHELISP